MDEQQFRLLLLEAEGNALDFKRDQYPFNDQPDDVKSELLKDILAFVNSFRRTDAYILIGVEEGHGNPAAVVGLTTHLEDSDLQEFVSFKTQRTADFSYQALTVDSKSVAVIHIPMQPRPVYLTKKYGPLAANTVYLRHGSATAIATPDEIRRMGEQGHVLDTSDLAFCFKEKNGGAILGPDSTVSLLLVDTPPVSAIPDYTGGVPPSMAVSAYAGQRWTPNREYYRSLARFIRDHASFSRLRMQITNRGTQAAHDVRARLECDDSSSRIILRPAYLASDLPQKLHDSYDFLPPRISALKRIGSRISYSRLDGGTMIADASFGKIQPKQEVECEDVLSLGLRWEPRDEDRERSFAATLKVSLYADNLPTPIRIHCGITIRPTRVQAVVADLEALASRITGGND